MYQQLFPQGKKRTDLAFITQLRVQERDKNFFTPAISLHFRVIL
jgi:hypothetical protein